MDQLGSISPTPVLTDEEFQELETLGHVIRYPAGSILLGEGEETDFALLIRKGHVKVVAGTPSRIVALRGPSDVIGEMAAVRQKPRSASIFALDDVEALFIPSNRWLAFLCDHPRAMLAQLFAADERLVEATRKSIESFLGAEQKLAKALVELESKDIGTPEQDGILLRFGQQDLADIAGVSRESVVQVIRQFKATGIVTTGRQLTKVRDLATLREIAQGHRTAVQE